MVYLQFGDDLTLGDVDQISILNCKRRVGDNREKTRIDLLRRRGSWQHGAQD